MAECFKEGCQKPICSESLIFCKEHLENAAEAEKQKDVALKDAFEDWLGKPLD
jgi:hypothetical protein